jgi:hypothetical protein
MADRNSSWMMSKHLAKAILHDRAQRRKWMARILMVALGLMAAGLWLVDDWLAGNPWRFLCWWGVCAVVTGGAMLFALYDMLMVIREERGNTSGKRK